MSDKEPGALAKAAQNEANSRPYGPGEEIIQGTSPDPKRQQKLREESGRSGPNQETREARKRLDEGTGGVQGVNEAAETNR